MHYVHAADLPINSIKFNRFHLNYSSNAPNSKNQLKNKPHKHQTPSQSDRPTERFAPDNSNEALNERSTRNDRRSIRITESNTDPNWDPKPDRIERRRSESNRRNESEERNDRKPNEQIAQSSKRRRRRRTDFKQSSKKLKRNKFANNRPTERAHDDWHQARFESLVGDGDRSSSTGIDNAEPRRASANKRNRSLLTKLNLFHQYTALMQSQLLPALFMSYNGSQLLPASLNSSGLSSGGLSSVDFSSVDSTSRLLTSSSASTESPKLKQDLSADLPADLSSSASRDLIDSFRSAAAVGQPYPQVAFLFASNQSYDTSYVTFDSSYEPSASYNSILSPDRDWLANRSFDYPDALPTFTSPTTLHSSTTSNSTSVPFFDMLNLNLILTILISVIMIACILLTAIGNLFVIAAILRDRVLVGCFLSLN